MTRTPWGNAEDLGERRLPPGRGTPREVVERSQRERLYAAMVAVSAEKGYEASTVEDLLKQAGVSRGDFYKLFADKQRCLEATVDEILKLTMEVVALRYDGRGSALRNMLELIAEQPAAAKLCFFDAYAGEEVALAAMDAAVERVEGLFREAFATRDGGAAKMPAEIVRAIVGGMRNLVSTRLRHGREQELGEMAGALWEWSFQYEPPSAALIKRRARIGIAGRYQPGEAGERIVRATSEIVAEMGYQASTLAAIAKRASMSLGTFYEHFDGKDAAVAAALDTCQAQLYGIIYPAFKRGREWPEAMRAALEAMFAFLAAEPALARMVTIGVSAGGPVLLDRRESMFQDLRRFLEPGLERAPRMPAITGEAICWAIYALVDDQIRRHGPERLPKMAPMASYLALGPFLGSEEACAVANG